MTGEGSHFTDKKEETSEAGRLAQGYPVQGRESRSQSSSLLIVGLGPVSNVHFFRGCADLSISR